jgi:hypothetical protein
MTIIIRRYFYIHAKNIEIKQMDGRGKMGGRDREDKQLQSKMSL